jgi:putative tricarboxylic transport membrane protein
MRKHLMRSTLILGVLIAVCLLPAVGFPAWQPSRPVQYIVPWAAGGGSDIIARQVVAIIELEKLSPVPFVVENRVGGNAMVALSHVMGKKGDPHTLMFATWTNLAVPLMEKIPYSLKDVTPIALYLVDEQMIWVPWNSPYKSLKDMVAASIKAPNSIKIGGASIGSEDHMANALFESVAGIKLNYIVFRGGAEATLALLGGHVDAGWLNPSEAVDHYAVKKIRPLGVAGKARLTTGMSEAPTFREQGFDVVFDNHFRGVTAPPGIPAEVAAYYVDLMKRVTQTARWDKYIKETMVTPAFMGGKEFGDYLRSREDLVRKLMALPGVMK